MKIYFKKCTKNPRNIKRKLYDTNLQTFYNNMIKNVKLLDECEI